MTQQAGGGRHEIVGTHQPGDEKIPHHEGFHRALEDALAKHDLSAGEHKANIHFGARIRVTNPGVIHEYVARVEIDPG